MSLFDNIKSLASIAQKADNIELYQQLLELGSQALEMQDEIRKLKEENAELKKTHDIEERVVNCPEGYIILKGDSSRIKYCAVCWGYEKKLIPLIDEIYCERCLERRREK